MSLNNFNSDCPAGCLNALAVINSMYEHIDWNDAFAGDLDCYDKLDMILVYYFRKLYKALNDRDLSRYVYKDLDEN